MLHHEMNDERKLQGKSHKDCDYNIMNNIIQRRKTEQRIYSLRADNHSFGKLFPLKRKANVKDKQRRVASFYIRIGFIRGNCEQRKIYFCG